jgi:hypothetical protein
VLQYSLYTRGKTNEVYYGRREILEHGERKERALRRLKAKPFGKTVKKKNK